MRLKFGMQDGNVCCKVSIFWVHQEQQPAWATDELDLPSLILYCLGIHFKEIL